MFFPKARMLSPASGCNLMFGTVKIEDTVDRMKSCNLCIYRDAYNFSLKKWRLRCNSRCPAHGTLWYVLVSEMSSVTATDTFTQIYTHIWYRVITKWYSCSYFSDLEQLSWIGNNISCPIFVPFFHSFTGEIFIEPHTVLGTLESCSV